MALRRSFLLIRDSMVVAEVTVQVTLTVTAKRTEWASKRFFASVSDDVAFIPLLLAWAREAPLAERTKHHLQGQHCTQSTTMSFQKAYLFSFIIKILPTYFF